jgi:hypothetical protein
MATKANLAEVLFRKEQQEQVLEPAELVFTLKKAGIHTLEDFANAVAPHLSRQRVINYYRALGAETIPQRTSHVIESRTWLQEGPGPFIQPAIGKPFKIDKTLYDPQDVHRFDGKALHFFADPKSEVLLAFTSGKDLFRALKDREQISSNWEEITGARDVALRHEIGGISSFFYQHINFGGAVLEMQPRHTWPNLTNVYFGTWPCRTAWNDQISSLRVGTYAVRAFADINYNGGDYFGVNGNTIVYARNSAFSWIGNSWNDRMSSIIDIV